MKRSARSRQSSRVRGDMVAQQRELLSLEDNSGAAFESYAASLMLKFIARKEVTMADLLGVNRRRQEEEEEERGRLWSSAGRRQENDTDDPEMETEEPIRRKRRGAPSRQAQLMVLLLCHYTVLGLGMFLFGLFSPQLLRQSPVTEPWLSIWLTGCFMLLLLVLGLALPAIFPALLQACCRNFMQHLRVSRFDYE